MPVIAAVEIVGDGPGRLRLAPIADYSADSIRAFVATNIACGATLKTDGWAAYPGTTEVDHDPRGSDRDPRQERSVSCGSGVRHRPAGVGS